MRLGGHIYKANKIEELEPLCEKLDELGLSAIPAPAGFWKWEDDDCIAFGESHGGRRGPTLCSEIQRSSSSRAM